MTSAKHTLNAAFEALADPTRRAILAQLADGELTVTQIAAPHALSQPGISHHLKVLEGAGLITRRVDGQRRPCRLADGTLEALEAWLDGLRKKMSANYARLDAVLAEEMAKETLNTGADDGETPHI